MTIACNRASNKEAALYFVDAKQPAETIRLSEFVDSVKYVKLEWTPSSRVSSISELYLDGDDLIVRSNNIIYIFSREGEFKASINKKGRGNGEYLEIDAMTVDPVQKVIMVCCNMQRALLSYSYDGKFIKKIDNFGESRPYIRDIRYLPNGSFLCSDYMHSSEAKNKLWLLDAQGKLLKDLIVGEFTFPVSIPSFTFFDVADAGIGFMDIGSDTDYIYQDGKLSAGAVYNVNGLTASDFKNVDMQKFSAEFWSQGKSFNSRVCTQYKGDYIISRWSSENRKIFYTLVNKSDGSITTARNIDGHLTNSQVVLPTVARTGAYIFRNNNIPGVLTTELVAADIEDVEVLKLLDIDANEAYNMNPLIQFIYVKM